MSVDEIVLPITKPETEWVRGRALRKVSPTWDHAALQGALLVDLTAWAAGRGRVMPELRFRIAVPGEPRRPLVPDLAYVRNERLRGFSHDDLQLPPFAPDVAIDVLSPGDRPVDTESKIDVYLRGGGALVLIFDPKRRIVRAVDAKHDRTFAGNEVFAHDELPGFTFVVADFFARVLVPPA